ncbi:uracil-DNA glycosylase [Pseudomonas aeruginosa]|nr:uracil-DNA glycosylase [Pseudomonas aeruginosa]MBA5106074.1 uracil-DNA glycosylase [Pseudomonas aeruginosa]MDP5990009.1 uracil-DNA glycosylase [Pseudomonas aeruginosa]HCE9175727.1 uracil-DNA glycosylase [Pseudomonas aeruginosa]HEJ9771286.1 uracil-DNA glycosylase [Pseudomonas aeruginosa]HEO1611764.1 uracil-DNA glycosylase [Pseudomonas aeruginosa]
MNMDLAKALIKTLPKGKDGLFNPWTDRCSLHTDWNGPEELLIRLAEHLDCVPEWICCGEAPGYNGARITGVAFTSERLIFEGSIPRNTSQVRLTRQRKTVPEVSATLVWKSLYRLGIAETTVLWNALQMHPHALGAPRTNRTPTDTEVQAGFAALLLLKEAFPQARWIATGKIAQESLLTNGIEFDAVRHPANGGSRLFAEGMSSLVGMAT